MHLLPVAEIRYFSFCTVNIWILKNRLNTNTWNRQDIHDFNLILILNLKEICKHGAWEQVAMNLVLRLVYIYIYIYCCVKELCLTFNYPFLFSQQSRLIYVLRDLPNIMCLGYLSISLPVRLIRALRSHQIKLISSAERVSILGLTKTLDASPEAIHVMNLLAPVFPKE